jgi:hypothetical protein
LLVCRRAAPLLGRHPQMRSPPLRPGYRPRRSS